LKKARAGCAWRTSRLLHGVLVPCAKDSSATMAFFSSLVYLIAASIIVPISILVGEIPNAQPSIVFVFKT
jgi:hypothetical protein